MHRECVECGDEFETDQRTLTCSATCKAARGREKSRRWRAANMDKVVLMERATRAKRKSNGKQLDYQRDRRSSPEGYVDRMLERARSRTPDSDLTRELLLTMIADGTCCVTGTQFEYENRFNCYHNPLAPSIDRIDSQRGYYADNVQIMLSCLNKFKNDLPNSDFLALWKALTGGNK